MSAAQTSQRNSESAEADVTPVSSPSAQVEPQAAASSAYYDEELPPDFWNREGTPVNEGQSIPLDGAGYEAAEALPSGLASASTSADDPSHALRSNPTYVTMTELFPGKIVAWHDDKQEADPTTSANDPDLVADPDEVTELADDDD